MAGSESAAEVRGWAGAYGASVRDEIESTTGHEVAQGGVYVTLTRLEKKGLLRSHLSDPTPVRGGMAKIPRTRSTIIHTR